MPRSRERERERVVAAVRAKLDTLPLDQQGLPMEHGPGAKLPLAEWVEYRERSARHRERFPAYDAGWRRPSAQTADAVWEHLDPAPTKSVEDLVYLPSGLRWRDVSADEQRALELTLEQAFAVAVDAALYAGDTGTMLTTNAVFDALAARWSDRYRAVQDAGRAGCAYDMTVETVRASWRDLLRNGVRLDAMWQIVRRGFPALYVTERIPKRGYTVTINVNSTLSVEYRKIVAADLAFQRGSGHPRLLLADESLPPRPAPSEVAGEWAYNRVVSGPRSDELIRRLQATRLWVNASAVMDTVNELEQTSDALRARLQRAYGVDVTKSPARPRGRRKTKSGKTRRSPRQWAMKHLRHRDIPAVKRLVGEYDHVTGQFKQSAGVRERLKALDEAGRVVDGHVQIQSAFYKVVNRRYQSVNFWPTEVTAKDQRKELIAEPEPDKPPVNGWKKVAHPALYQVSSRRGRWFTAAATGLDVSDQYADLGWVDDWAGDRRPLVGVDVSSSQLQILAVFCGLTRLEEELIQHSFKEALAARAWACHEDPADPFTLPPGFEGGAKDPRLKEAVKTAVMTHLYGSELPDVARKLRASSSDYGPGLGDEANLHRLLTIGHVTELLTTFLPVCQAVAEEAYKRDPCAGVMFTDPYDGARVRWNEPRRRRRVISRQDVKIEVYLPVGKRNAAGDYPVDDKKLRRMVAPCLTHMLDAMFAGLVVERLNARGVRDIVSVHDCWMVASDALPALGEAVAGAGQAWLEGLGGVYDDLLGYLDGGLAQRVQEWRTQWRRRVKAGRWPSFRVSGTTLKDLEVAPRAPAQKVQFLTHS